MTFTDMRYIIKLDFDEKWGFIELCIREDFEKHLPKMIRDLYGPNVKIVCIKKIGKK